MQKTIFFAKFEFFVQLQTYLMYYTAILKNLRFFANFWQNARKKIVFVNFEFFVQFQTYLIYYTPI